VTAPPREPPGEPPRALPESQPERTRLAWRRTQLALGATFLLAVATAVRRASPSTAVLYLLPIAVVIGIAIAVAARRITAVKRPGFGRIRWSASLLAVCVIAAAILGAVLIGGSS